MILQGRGAAQFRKKSADVVVRFLGGDPHIVEEIAANRLAQEHLPQNHPMRIFGETVQGESEELRKKREAVQLAELDLQLADIRGRAKQARVESVTESVESGLNCMRNLGLPIDDRARARAADMIQQAVFEEAHDAPGDPEICVRHFLQSKGIRDPSMDSRLGKLAKQLLLKSKPTHVFPKKSIFLQWADDPSERLARIGARVLGASVLDAEGCTSIVASPAQKHACLPVVFDAEDVS